MLGVKELLIKLLNDIQNIKQKLNKPIIVSNSIMTEAKDCSANNYGVLAGYVARVQILYRLIEGGAKFLRSCLPHFLIKRRWVYA